MEPGAAKHANNDVDVVALSWSRDLLPRPARTIGRCNTLFSRMRTRQSNPGPLPALVTDVELRGPLNAVRALGRAGIPVIAVGPSRGAAGLWSRYATETFVAPHPERDPLGFAEHIIRVGAGCGRLVLYPGSEASIDALLTRGLPPNMLLPYPGVDVLQSLRDKQRLAALARTARLHAPEVLASGPAPSLRASEIPTPCVVKMARPGEGKFIDPVARTTEQLAEMLARRSGHDEVIVQELIEGPVTSLALVVDRDGKVVAHLQQVALRARPERVGITSLAVSVAPDDELVARSGRMLAEAGYWGLAQLQFLDAPRRPTLIDVNPRFYGTLSLASACGVDVAAAWHAVASGQSYSRQNGYRTGVTYRFLENDVKTALEGAPRCLIRRAPSPRVGATWAADDPVGAALMTAASIVGPAWRYVGRAFASNVRPRRDRPRRRGRSERPAGRAA
jgi:predicted ATP-grasp superfamily ATP-dependent carboligase